MVTAVVTAGAPVGGDARLRMLCERALRRAFDAARARVHSWDLSHDSRCPSPIHPASHASPRA